MRGLPAGDGSEKQRREDAGECVDCSTAVCDECDEESEAMRAHRMRNAPQDAFDADIQKRIAALRLETDLLKQTALAALIGPIWLASLVFLILTIVEAFR